MTTAPSLPAEEPGAPEAARRKGGPRPAGGEISNLDDVRKLTRGNCKELE